MTDLPAAAVTAARKGVRAYYVDNISMIPAERDVEHLEAMADAALEAAAPHITAAATTAERHRIARDACAEANRASAGWDRIILRTFADKLLRETGGTADACTQGRADGAAAERDRIIALIEAEENKLRAFNGPQTHIAADALSDIADLLTEGETT